MKAEIGVKIAEQNKVKAIKFAEGEAKEEVTTLRWRGLRQGSLAVTGDNGYIL